MVFIVCKVLAKKENNPEKRRAKIISICLNIFFFSNTLLFATSDAHNATNRHTKSEAASNRIRSMNYFKLVQPLEDSLNTLMRHLDANA